MVTDRQVRRLMQLMETGEKLMVAALKTGMDEKTARKYIRTGKLPSEVKELHTWRTRKDPFEEVWDEVLENLEAKTLFDALQRLENATRCWQVFQAILKS